MSPLCESYLTEDQLDDMEPFYPLHTWVCESCLLVQLDEYVRPDEIFSDYAYFSSYSDSWLEHARRYVESAIDRFELGPAHHVVELGSNDGYLLRYFVRRGVPVLGIEPAANVAETAIDNGVPTRVAFFGPEVAAELVQEGRAADLIVGNNVLAQVPDVNGFVGSMRTLLKPHGVITMEFPHLARLVEGNQFDTIYHEHFSYFSLIAVERLFAAHDLTIFDVEELPSHGGSLRIFARRADDLERRIRPSVRELRDREERAGMRDLAYYASFRARVEGTKRRLLDFLIREKDAGSSIVGYGAPGKGNTLLNYCGVRTDLLDFVVDRSPHKQGKFLPGTHIPIHHPDLIDRTEPDVVLIMPWNLRHEIARQLSHVRSWGGRLAVPIPEPTVLG
jgi:SAM-dependent methyltransferase